MAVLRKFAPACATTLAGLGLLAALAVPVPPANAQVPMTSGTSVMGRPAVTARQLADYYYSKKGYDFARLPTLDGDVERLAKIFIDEGRNDGVRGDIAFMQTMLETGWLEFKDYGQIRPTFNNFAGMFAYDGRPIGTTCAAEEAEEAAGGLKSRCFDSPELGVRAQIHKLRSYADASVANVSGRLGYAPSYSRGKAPYWEQFGGASGIAIWATAPDYGNYILTKMYLPMLNRLGITLPCQPSGANTSGTSGNGYWVITSAGRSYEFGAATRRGGAAAAGAEHPVVDIAAAPDGGGYWQLTTDGEVWAFGSAVHLGSLGRARLGTPAVAIVETPSGDGYWIVTADGGVYPFGDADDVGNLGREVLRATIVDADRTADGQGMWLVFDDGSLRALGTAVLHGTPAEVGATSPPVAIGRSASGGYVVVTARGRVLAFGDARRVGDTAGCGLPNAVDIDTAPSGDGYWVTLESGEVFAFGTARNYGSPTTLAAGAVGLARF